MAAKSTLKLTRDSLARLKPSGQIYWFCGAHENLGVYVSARGATWRVRLNIVQPSGALRRKVGSLGPVAQVSIEDAVAKKKAAELAARDGVDLTELRTQERVKGAPTVSFLLDLYIRTANIKPSTAERYRKAKVHIDRLQIEKDLRLGDKLISELTRGDILMLRDSMDRTRNTFNKARDLFCAALNFFGDRGTKHAGRPLVREGFNPVRMVKRWTSREMNRKKSDPYMAGEVRALLAAAERYLDPKIRATFANGAHIPRKAAVACIVGLFYSGCRKGELMAVSKYPPKGAAPEGWSGWVDRAAGVIRLVNTKTGAREVFITPQLEALFAFMWDDDPFWVFPGRVGRPVEKLEKAWNRLHADSGVRRRNIHQTRHTLVHHMVDQGVGLGPAGGAVGHGSIHMTQTYAHIADTSARRAHLVGAQALGDLEWSFLRPAQP